jgi:hypothetical protein
MIINIHKEVEIESTQRTELLSSMFEVPAKTKLSVSLTGESDHDRGDRDYNIGLIVGPSGSGKTLLLNSIFGAPKKLQFEARSVIDDFPSFCSMEDISRVCQSVGFNTIPSWLRPYSVLSNGERFRVDTAIRLLDSGDVTTVDEFTSVVDRQVAQFACHAIQRYVRETKKKLVVASCHYDIINWLQPDWILEPGNPCHFTWRSLRSRPSIDVSVSRVQYKTWSLFRDFHYMSQDLNKAARCYGLYVKNSIRDIEGRASESSPSESRAGIYKQSVDRDSTGRTVSDELSNQSFSLVFTSVEDLGKLRTLGRSINPYRIASLCGVLYRPHPRVSDIYGFTRMVTLPDFQGLGLAFVLACKVASAYKALGKRLHSYPNHPAWIRSYQRSKDWIQIKESGLFSPKRGVTSTVGGFGGRRCAVFMYNGPEMNKEEAERLINVPS